MSRSGAVRSPSGGGGERREPADAWPAPRDRLRGPGSAAHNGRDLSGDTELPPSGAATYVPAFGPASGESLGTRGRGDRRRRRLGDGSVEIVHREFPEVTLVALDQNLGYPTAVNAGVVASHGEWVFTLNNDTTVDETIFDRLLAVARSAGDVGIVAAQQRFSSNPDTIYSAGMIVDRRGHASDRLMGEPAAMSEPTPIDVFGACGAAALYRRSLLAEHGGFDPLFAFGLEDADVAWRAQARGWALPLRPRRRRPARPPAAPFATDRRPASSRPDITGCSDRRKSMKPRRLSRHCLDTLLFDVAYLAKGTRRSACGRLHQFAGASRDCALWRTARQAGASQRARVALSTPAPLLSALARRRAWERARAAGSDPAPRWLRRS